MYCIELSRYRAYEPILPSGILLSHWASASFGRQRSSDSWNTSTTLTTLNPRDSKRRMEGVFAIPILTSRLCGLTPTLEIVYERLLSVFELETPPSDQSTYNRVSASRANPLRLSSFSGCLAKSRWHN